MIGFVGLLRGAEKIAMLKFLARVRVDFFRRGTQRMSVPAAANAYQENQGEAEITQG